MIPKFLPYIRNIHLSIPISLDFSYITYWVGFWENGIYSNPRFKFALEKGGIYILKIQNCVITNKKSIRVCLAPIIINRSYSIIQI